MENKSKTLLHSSEYNSTDITFPYPIHIPTTKELALEIYDNEKSELLMSNFRIWFMNYNLILI